MRSWLLGIMACVVAGCGGGGGGGGGAVAAPEADPRVFPVFETEANDTPSGANPITVGETGAGDLYPNFDRDHWRVELMAGEIYRIEVSATSLDQDAYRSGADGSSVRIRVFDPSGTFVVENLADSRDRGIPYFDPASTGEYVIELESEVDFTGGLYAFSVTRPDLPNLQREAEEAGSLPDITRANDSFATAQPITPGTIAGYFAASGVDTFSFTNSESSWVQLRLFGDRCGRAEAAAAPLRTRIEVFLNGTSISTGELDFLFDPGCEFLASPGTYYIQVRDGSFGNGSSGPYVLEFDRMSAEDRVESASNTDVASALPLGSTDTVVGTLPLGQSHFYRFDGQRGDALRFFLHDSDSIPGGVETAIVRILDASGTRVLHVVQNRSGGFEIASTILDDTGEFLVEIWTPLGAGSGPYALRRELVRRGTAEIEPNDSISDATPLDGVGVRAGSLPYNLMTSESDVDYWRFTADEGQFVQFAQIGGGDSALEAAIFGSFDQSVNARLRILDASGAVLAESVESTDPATRRPTQLDLNIEIGFIAPESGAYFLEVIQDPDNLPFINFANPSFEYLIERLR